MADRLRKFLQKEIQLRQGQENHFKTFKPDEVDTMIKVLQVVRFNMFSTEKDDYNPIHVRRQMYLKMKEFTCHCPRCDAVGDDTRQFDCVDLPARV